MGVPSYKYMCAYIDMCKYIYTYVCIYIYNIIYIYIERALFHPDTQKHAYTY